LIKKEVKMELIAFLGKDELSWGQVTGVVKQGDWENIIIIGNDFARKFSSEKEFEFIEVKSASLVDIKEELLKKLQGKVKGTEVALSIASGNGKEHMALISALLSLPAGIRFTALTKDGIIFM